MSVALDFAAVFTLKDPIQWVHQFKALAASQALSYGAAQLSNPSYSISFQNYDLETKLWHLAALLYEFRATESPKEITNTLPQSSDAVKQHNYLSSHRKAKEVAIIITWIQENSKQLDIPTNVVERVKWNATRTALESKSLTTLTLGFDTQKKQRPYVSELDDDAVLRSGKSIAVEDDNQDLEVYKIIYGLVLQARIDEAVEVANNSGNFALALILIGAVNDYVDPILDKHLFNSDNILPVDEDTMDIDNNDPNDPNQHFPAPTGQRHKTLWCQTVYSLSQRAKNPHERLIYNYLCGGDISENVAVAESWEQALLLYLNQLLGSQLREVLSNQIESISSIHLPPAQCKDVDQALNIILRSENSISARESQNPLRILTGALMIEKFGNILANGTSEASNDPHLLRVLAHLAIFVYNYQFLGNKDSVSAADLTRIVGQYVKYLAENNLEELIPTYLAHIPEEADARELYSEFLISLVDPEKREKQIGVARKFNDQYDDYLIAPVNGEKEDPNYEGKMVNVLRRTVEKVMNSTADSYKPDTSSQLVLQDEIIDPQDLKLYRAVDWFFETNLYEDAITASITTIRRFLLNGKLKALKGFGAEKNFIQLIKDYDFSANTKLLSSNSVTAAVSENDKEELQQYGLFIQGLSHIEEWKTFLKENQVNGVLKGSKKFWESSYVEKAIEKVTTSLLKLIFNWLRRLIEVLHDSELLLELRSIYVPYLTMELLQIYQYSRFNDWKYMKNAFSLINSIANDEDYDLLKCFIKSGRLEELVFKSGQVAVEATERGMEGIFV